MSTLNAAIEALACIRSGERVFIQGQAATPTVLIDALAARGESLRGVETVHLHLEGDAPHARPDLQHSFRANAFFVGANLRLAVAEHRADYLPVSLSEIHKLLGDQLPLDAALIHVSPPDRHGFCSLGTSVDITAKAVRVARHVVAQMNPLMPRTFGDATVHVSRFTAAVEVEVPLAERVPSAATEVEERIGRLVASLIEDGATLQMGIGAVPDAVLRFLTNHRRLGVHTEMFSDGLVPLLEAGVVTNEEKRRRRHKVVTSFVMGSKRLYDFVHDNPSIEFRESAFVNDATVIAQNPKVVAINSALEVDLTGQVCADSIGERIFSGVGGQADFMRGAALSLGGKPIIALPSVTSDGQSRIVALIKAGAGVVTPRAQAHFVVTEHGAAQLFGKNLRQRAAALVAIAHPMHREQLERAAHERFGTQRAQ